MTGSGGSSGPVPRRRRTSAVVVAAFLLLLAGCAGSLGYQGPTGDEPTSTAHAPNATLDPLPTAQPVPPHLGPASAARDRDRLGWEDGYAHDDPVPVTVDDGLNESERRAVVARTMARVERIRDVEFRESVPVEVVSRAEYRERNVTFVRRGGERFDRWRNAVWEAPLLVGEGTDAGAAIDALFGSAVRGYYVPSRDRIVLVVDEGSATIDTRTLAHELVHAVQNRRGWTVDERDTLDGRLAADGLTEGDAAAVDRAYAARCREDWDCLPPPGGPASNVSAVVEYQGLYLVFRQPYVAGSRLVDDLRERGGWARVNGAYDRPPESTVETSYPDRYPASPATVSVPDRSSDGWERYRFGAETVGSAAIHAMLWSHGELDRTDDAIATDYRDRHTRNWTGDTLVPYTNGSHDGYVWRLRFATAGAARTFQETYARILTFRLGGHAVDSGTYVVPDGPFADAFRVDRDGEAVTVVNAPAPSALDDVHREGET